MIVTSLSLALLWWYVVPDRNLVNPDIDSVVVRYNTAGILLLPMVFLLAIGISLISTAAAGFFVMVLFLVQPVTGWYARRQTG
jgi:hypothetical protein